MLFLDISEQNTPWEEATEFVILPSKKHHLQTTQAVITSFYEVVFSNKNIGEIGTYNYPKFLS